MSSNSIGWPLYSDDRDWTSGGQAAPDPHGRAVWYAALRGLSATRAAVLQLAVPILAAGGGVVFLLEAISLRLIVSTVLVVGGIALTVMTADKAQCRSPLSRTTSGCT